MARDTYWDTKHVRYPKAWREKIRELMKAAGCKTFSDYVRAMLRARVAPPA